MQYSSKSTAWDAAKAQDRIVSKLERKAYNAVTKKDKESAWNAVDSAKDEAYRLWIIYDSRND